MPALSQYVVSGAIGFALALVIVYIKWRMGGYDYLRWR